MRLAGAILVTAIVSITFELTALAGPGLQTTAGKRTFLDLFVNTLDKGPALVVVRGLEILIEVEDLRKAGLRTVGGKRESIAGKTYVPLSSLTPGVSYSFDINELVVRLTVDPRLLGVSELAIRDIRPAGITYLANPSVFVNYGFDTQNFNSYSLFTEGGLSLDGDLLYSSLSLSPQQQVLRGLTNLTIDKPERLIRLVIGDAVADTGLLGGTVFLGGVGLSRDFGLNPYFIPYPMQRLSGLVTMPSLADIYVNGVLVRQVNLPPGAFNMSDLPFPAGAGNTQVIIRNTLGQQQVIGAPYYLSTQVLEQGLNEYSYNFGLLRHHLGTASWQYGPLAVAGNHLYGVTDSVTAGAFVQADADVASGGPQVALRTPLGQLGLWSALSSGQATGWSAAATYSYLSRIYSFGADLTVASNRYSTLSLTPKQDRATLLADAFVGAEIGRLTVFPELRYSDYRDAGRSYSATVICNFRLSNSMNLQLSASRSLRTSVKPTTDLFVAVNFFLGHSTLGTVSYDHVTGQPNRTDLATVQLQRSLPLGVGYGYLLQGQTGSQAQQIANFQYQGSYGLYQLNYSRLMGQNLTDLNISGGLVGIGGHLFATRPVHDSYGVIQVPGLQGVTGYYSNQSVGRTDDNGEVFIPDLLAYYGNDLSIDEHDIPMDYAVEATRRLVATPYRGGTIVTFPVHRLRAFTGRIEVTSAGKGEIPAYGELTVTAAGKEFSSPIGRRGEFYLENLPAGNWPGVVDYQGGRCNFAFVVASAAERFVKMGILRCHMPP